MYSKSKLKALSLLLLVVVIFVPISVYADYGDESRTHLKVFGGISYSTLSGEDGVFGPTAGAQFDIRVSSQLVYVGAGIEYMNKGFRQNSNSSLVVPFLGSYHIPIGGMVSIEPFAGITISYGFNREKLDCGLRLGCILNSQRWDFTVG